jgi:SAM-dependent methyltransferase
VTSGLDTCPMCGATLARATTVSARLVLRRCRSCGHTVAGHLGAAVAADYHTQYDEGVFLAALEQTRKRQAAVLVSMIRSLLPSADGILDYGCGRGWFLVECRRLGMTRLAGADASAKAVSIVRALGMEGIEIVPGPDGKEWTLPVERLTFAPRVVAFLDVIEHLPPDRCRAILERTLAAIGPQLELVVIKVPVPGILYGASMALAKLGRPGALEQMYQVGTTPPHLSYFSRRSLRRLVAACGLEVAAERGDLEFEPESLVSRARAARGAPSAVSRAAGFLVATAGRASGAYDTVICVARRRHAPDSASGETR